MRVAVLHAGRTGRKLVCVLLIAATTAHELKISAKCRPWSYCFKCANRTSTFKKNKRWCWVRLVTNGKFWRPTTGKIWLAAQTEICRWHTVAFKMLDGQIVSPLPRKEKLRFFFLCAFPGRCISKQSVYCTIRFLASTQKRKYTQFGTQNWPSSILSHSHPTEPVGNRKKLVVVFHTVKQTVLFRMLFICI